MAERLVAENGYSYAAKQRVREMVEAGRPGSPSVVLDPNLVRRFEPLSYAEAISRRMVLAHGRKN